LDLNNAQGRSFGSLDVFEIGLMVVRSPSLFDHVSGNSGLMAMSALSNIQFVLFKSLSCSGYELRVFENRALRGIFVPKGGCDRRLEENAY
jgi:hypothetical protein